MHTNQNCSLRAWTATLVGTVLLSACGGEPGERAVATQDRIVAKPAQPERCLPPEPDSTAVVSAALSALTDPLPLKVTSFVRHHEGSLVSLGPTEPAVVGGGGLVWVDRDGCLTILKVFE